jgi:glycosyltransferase involved in cell wall biosynthesis
MRILIALPGLHRVLRGAEVAFEELGKQLALLPDCEVTLIGSGAPRANTPYKFHQAPCISREVFERWPVLPYLRGEYVYEELTFLPGLIRSYHAKDFDVTVTCSYPYTSWALRAKRNKSGPKHFFVTQNGDWMCTAKTGEYKHFACDGLICTNPDYFEQHKNSYVSTLIPNGVDLDQFTPGVGDRAMFNIPNDVPLALMVSALVPSKRVLEGIRSCARVDGLHLAVAGDGGLRDEVESLGKELMGDRFHLLKLPREKMPGIYRCADVFLHMSQDEPFGNVYIEALSTGIPVVMHDRPVSRWIIEDQGILVDSSDEYEVANALKMALGTKTDARIRSRRSLVERRFSWQALAKQYYAFFQEVCCQEKQIPKSKTLSV